jgi:hypothetical protein
MSQQPTPTRPYRILVTGSRDWTRMDLVHAALATACYQNIPATIVHGACPTGADAQAGWWAREHQVIGLAEERHRAQDFGPWPAAGPRRNAHMVSLGADICLAFIGPCTKASCKRPHPHGSHGASGCATLAETAGIPVLRWVEP